jgi:hypothetical protein
MRKIGAKSMAELALRNRGVVLNPNDQHGS